MKIIASSPSDSKLLPRITTIITNDPSKWSPASISISSTPYSYSVSDISEPTTVITLDREFSRQSTLQLIPSAKVFYSTNIRNPNIIFSSSNENIAIVSNSGTVTKTNSDGTVTITCTETNHNISDTIEVAITSSNSGYIDTFQNFVNGYLSYECEQEVNSRINGATTAKLPIFSVQNHASQIYTRNTDCWIYDLRQKATCISPWNSTGANTRAGTLITPRHIIFSAHYEIAEGATIRFITADNQVVNRAMIKRKRHPNYVPYQPDLTVGVLDSDVPEAITPCKILPSTYSNYFPTAPKYIAAICLDQEEKALVTDLNAISGGMVSFIYPNNPYEQILYENKIVGDSGNPAFLIINGEFVLLTCWTYGGAGSGTFISDYIDDINQMISDVDTLAANGGTGYTLSTIDLGGFTVL